MSSIRGQGRRVITVCLPRMWPGEQPTGGGPDPRHQPNPDPHARPGVPPSGGWHAAPTTPVPAPPGGGGGSRRTAVIAVVAAAAVVVAAAVTGTVLLGGEGTGRTVPGPAASTGSTGSPAGPGDDPRGGDGVPRPTVQGWKTVVNPDLGIAFDVPASWERQSPDWVSYVAEDDDPEEKPLVAMKAPAVLQEQWCSFDDDRDGSVDHTPLATAGTRGNNGARGTEEIARTDSANWVYGLYTQPDRAKVSTGPVASFTTASGVTGSVATSRSSGVARKDKCDSDGKATTFAFKSADGDLVSWSFVGPRASGRRSRRPPSARSSGRSGSTSRPAPEFRYVPDKGR